MKNDATNKGKDGREAARPAVSDMMQEVWSLQRDVLRELMTGFRRLEHAQRELQVEFARQLEVQISRPTSDPRAAERDAEFAALVDSRFKSLEQAVTRIEAGVRALPSESGADVASKLQEILAQSGNSSSHEVVLQLADTRTALRETVAELHHAVSGGLTHILDQTKEALQFVRAEMRTNLETSQQQVAARLDATHAQIRGAMQESQSWLQSALDRDVSGMRESLGSTRQSVEDAISETRIGVQDFVGRSVTEARDVVVQSVDRLTQEVRQVRDLRAQVQSALDGLQNDVRDVSAVAGRLESSSVLTQELLDEQRTHAAAERDRQRREDARKHNNAGVLCYHQGAYDGSVKHFRKAIELDAKLTEAYNNLGLSYTEMGRDEEASDAFTKALEIDPTLGQVYNNLGYLFHRRGDLEHAVEMYERAIQRSNDTSAAYTNLGNALYKLKRVDDSVKAWRRAVEIDPANHKAAAALERVGLGGRLDAQ